MINEELKNEITKGSDAPKRSRKTFTILLIVIVAIVAVSVFAWWYTQTTSESSTISPRYLKFSKYGFSFEYPEDMSISEQGMLGTTATSDSGLILGELSNGKFEIITVGWMTTATELDLDIILTSGLEGMESTGVEVDAGQIKTSTKDGDILKYQDFTSTVGGQTSYGILGVWICGTNNRMYQFILMTDQQDTFSVYQKYLDSFVCH